MKLKSELQKKDLTISESEIRYLPKTPLSSEHVEEDLLKQINDIVEVLEEHEDVLRVHTNIE